MSEGGDAWARACLALDLLGASPGKLRGLTLRARSGPVRESFITAVSRLPMKVARASAAMPEETFFGGVDVTASLASGRMIERRGLIGEIDLVILATAERCPLPLAARLAAALDDGALPALILLDEGTDPEERAPDALRDRLAFDVTLEGIGRLEATPPPARTYPDPRAIRLPTSAARTLVGLAAHLGVPGLRAPMLALDAARAHARLDGRDRVNEDDIRVAAELVLAPRSTTLPAPDAPPPAPEADRDETDSERGKDGEGAIDPVLVEAVRAVVPPGLIEANAKTSARGRSTGGGFGQRMRGNRRGRPLPSRAGEGHGRIDIVSTLRAAAPWQALRGKSGSTPKIWPEDLRYRRFETLSDRLVIFVVDASGSAAMARLAEAKGAVEIMLAEAYARRDHVALLSFSGTEAELLLPPTRSLTQTKRRLAALPGGGGTPLAAGLCMALSLATLERRKGLSPVLALLTDGRANIALDGKADRAAALEDAKTAARGIAAQGIDSVTLDVSRRPNPQLAELARAMGGRHVPLPHASAETLADALRRSLDDELVA